MGGFCRRWGESHGAKSVYLSVSQLWDVRNDLYSPILELSVVDLVVSLLELSFF